MYTKLSQLYGSSRLNESQKENISFTLNLMQEKANSVGILDIPTAGAIKLEKNELVTKSLQSVYNPQSKISVGFFLGDLSSFSLNHQLFYQKASKAKHRAKSTAKYIDSTPIIGGNTQSGNKNEIFKLPSHQDSQIDQSRIVNEAFQVLK